MTIANRNMETARALLLVLGFRTWPSESPELDAFRISFDNGTMAQVVLFSERAVISAWSEGLACSNDMPSMAQPEYAELAPTLIRFLEEMNR